MPRSRANSIRAVVVLLLLGLLLYWVVPQIKAFHATSTVLQNAEPSLVALAIVASLAAHTTAAVKYNVLAFHRLRFGRTLLVQFAGLLTNRLLPAGIGGMGINYVYFRRERHTALQAATVIGVNNLLGLVGHMLLVAVLLVFAPSFSAPQLHVRLTRTIVLGVLGGMVFLALLAVLLHAPLGRSIKQLGSNLAEYRRRPVSIASATACSVLLAAFYATCLWYCARALHSPVSFLAAMVVLTLGVTAGTVAPTPGGLVGVEAALVGGLVLYKVPAADALAITLLYRFVTYWLALIIGAVSLVAAERLRII